MTQVHAYMLHTCYMCVHTCAYLFRSWSKARNVLVTSSLQLAVEKPFATLSARDSCQMLLQRLPYVILAVFIQCVCCSGQAIGMLDTLQLASPVAPRCDDFPFAALVKDGPRSVARGHRLGHTIMRASQRRARHRFGTGDLKKKKREFLVYILVCC